MLAVRAAGCRAHWRGNRMRTLLILGYCFVTLGIVLAPLSVYLRNPNFPVAAGTFTVIIGVILLAVARYAQPLPHTKAGQGPGDGERPRA